MLKAWFKNTKKVYRIEWLIAAAMLLLFAASYIYGDILVTARHSMDFTDLLFKGRIRDFYALSEHTVSGNPYYSTEIAAYYDLSIYILFAIWCFPLWAIEKLFLINPLNNFLCLLWLKALPVLCIGLTLWTLWRIATKLGFSEKARRWLCFAFLTSILLCTSTVMISQYDIFSLLCMLLGYLAYLKKNTAGFLLWFSLAVSFKFFALLVFIPLCLLRYKQVWKLLCLCLAALAITLIGRLLLPIPPVEGKGTSINLMLWIFFYSTVDFSYYPAGIFLCCMLAICIWAYLREDNGEEAAAKDSVYAVAAAMLAFICTNPLNPYWSVLATPFLCLLLFMRPERLKINLYLETALSLSLFVQQLDCLYWCFCNRTVMPMLFGQLMGRNVNPEHGIKGLLDLAKQSIPVLTIVASVTLVSAIALLIINYPSRMRTPSGDLPVERSVFWARTAAMLLVGAMPIVYYMLCS